MLAPVLKRPLPELDPASSDAATAAFYRDGFLISTLMQATGRSYPHIRKLLARTATPLRSPRHSAALLQDRLNRPLTTAP